MKEFINKLIGRLEEAKVDIGEKTGFSKGINKSIEIVKELAEEYNGNDYWKIIYNKVCELEKKYANDGNTETVNDCIKLENLLQYFKEELRSEEEYINTSTDTSTTNADRIRSMSDEELAEFLCKVKADYQWITQDFPREDECDEWVIWLQSEVEGVTENE